MNNSRKRIAGFKGAEGVGEKLTALKIGCCFLHSPICKGLVFFVLVFGVPLTVLAEEKKVVDLKTEIKKNEDEKVYHCDLELGNLTAGSKVTIKLELNNPFDQSIKFSGVSNKCKCKQFLMKDSVIAPGETTNVSFDIDIPARKRNPKVYSEISLVDDGISVIRLQLTYSLDGMLGFSELMSIVRFDNVDEVEKKIQVPFNVTKPLMLSDVTASTSENLNALAIKIVENESDKPKVEVTIPDSILKSGSVRGELFIEHAKSNQKDTYLITIKDTRANEISPKITKFQKLNDEFKATSILKLAGSTDALKDPSSVVKCKIGEKELNVKCQKLNRNTFKVTISGDSEWFSKLDTTDSELEMHWEVFNGSTKSKMTTSVIVEKTS